MNGTKLTLDSVGWFSLSKLSSLRSDNNKTAKKKNLATKVKAIMPFKSPFHFFIINQALNRAFEYINVDFLIHYIP